MMKRIIKIILLVSLLSVWSGEAMARTCISTGVGGNWGTTATWSCSGGNRVPTTADTVEIASGSPVTVNVTTANVTSVTVDAGGILTQSSPLNDAGILSVAGTLNSTAAMTIGGAATVTGTMTIGAGAVATFNNTLTVTGVTLTNNGTVKANAALSGTGGLTNGATGTLNIATTSGITTLTASAAGNTVNYTGAAQTVNATAYSNLGLSGSGVKTLTGVTTIGQSLTMSGTATATEAAALSVGGNLTIGASNTFANSTYALNVAGNFTQNGTFTPGTGVVTLNGGTQTISGTATVAFTNLTVSNTAITLAQNVTVTSAIIGTVTLTSTCPNNYTITSNNGGTVQESCTPVCNPPPNIPGGVTVTCVCDNFGRANLNPSTIFGGTYAISDGTSDLTGVFPYINGTSGYLRLTENTGNNAKAATVPSIFPAAGNYISVEFNHYAYNSTSSGGIGGGSGNTGADGIAVTLSDYSIPAVPGGFGGSLGYAQSTGSTPNPPGFAGGWIGVGLDEYGNYQNTNEGRQLGPNTSIYQSVAMRGPGSGMNGYRWMAGTGSNPGGLGVSNAASATPAPGYMYQVIVDARNVGTNIINVSVNRDATTKNGNTYTSLIAPFNAYTEANNALASGWISQIVPNFWKISFTGSTGGSNNIHEIGGLRICAQSIAPATGGTASGYSAIDSAYPGSPPAYPNFSTGHIYTKLVGTPFNLYVAALTSTAIQTGYSALSAKYVQVQLVDNSDNGCGPIGARTPNILSCMSKTAVEAGATQIATFVSGSNTGVASPNPAFTLNSAYQNLVAVMRECTTSTCAAFTATTPACSADSFSVRPWSVSISSVDNNAATTGSPTVKAGSNFTLTATTTGAGGINIAGYKGTLQYSNAPPVQPGPGTVAGTLAGSFPSATPSPAPSKADGIFTYSEVGGFKMPVDSVYDNTWTLVDSPSDCVAGSYSNVMDTSGTFLSNTNFDKYGCNFGTTAVSGTFGRFIPDHFNTVITPGMPCPTGLTCPMLIVANDQGFVYSGQPFTTQVTAQNSASAPTQNYDNTMSLSKNVTLTAWDTPGSIVTQNPPIPPNAGSFLPGSNTVAASAFKNGATTLGTAIPTYSLPNPYPSAASPPGPTNIYIRAVDSDLPTNVSSLRAIPANSVEGGVMIVSGRLNISNAHGSELLQLPIAVTAQYWNGTSYVTSSTDSVSSFAAGAVLWSNCQKLSATSTWPSTMICTPPTSVSPASVMFGKGMGSFILAKPGAGNTGSVDMTTNAPSYLPSNKARATFGVYKGANEFIYLRENY